MNNDDDALAQAVKKLEREKVLLNAANAMRQQTHNESVRAKLDNQMREGRRNISYLEQKLEELQLRKSGHAHGYSAGGSNPGSSRPTSSGMRDKSLPPSPSKPGSHYVARGTDRGDYGTEQYSNIGGHGDMMPPRHPYGPPGPESTIPKSRPNYTKLGWSSYSSQSPSLTDLVR